MRTPLVCGLTFLVLLPSPARPAAPIRLAAPRVDRYGDALPADALMRLGTTRFQHVDARQLVERLAFSPDGKRVASGAGRFVHVWEVDSGKELLRFAPPAHLARSVVLAFGPGGKTLAGVSYDRKLNVWDMATGRALRREVALGDAREPPLRWAYGAFSPDGKYVAVGLFTARTGVMELYEVATAKKVRDIPEGWGGSRPVFSDDGRTLAVRGGDRRVRLWEVDSGKRRQTLRGSEEVLGPMALSPDGKQVAVSGEGQVTWLYDSATGKGRRVFGGREYATRGLAFTPDGKHLLVSGHQHVRAFDAGTGKLTQTYAGPSRYVNGIIAFSPDRKRFAAPGEGAAVRVVDLATGKDVCPLVGHRGYVATVRFAPDGSAVATAGADRTVRLWDVKTGAERRRWQHDVHRPCDLAFTPDGKQLLSLDDGLRCLDVKTGKASRRLSPDSADVFALSPDGTTLATESSAQVVLRGAVTGKERFRMPVTDDERAALFLRVLHLVFSPDGSRLLVAAQAEDGGKPKGDGDDRNGSYLQLLDLRGRKVLRRFEAGRRPRDRWWGAAFSPDGRWVAAQSDGTVFLWEADTGRKLRELGDRGVRSFAFSPDGKWLAAGVGDGDVRLWELATGQAVHTFTGHRGDVNSLAFAPDGRTLATASADGTALLWGLFGITPARAGKLAAKELDALWNDLSGADPGKAYRALRALAAVPEQAVPDLRERLRKAPAPVTPARLARLVADLDDDEFTVREKASKELARLGRSAELALRKARAAKPSAEAARRIDALLTRLKDPTPPPEHLRASRAVALLEHLATPAAKKLLDEWARGPSPSPLTDEARAANARRKKR